MYSNIGELAEAVRKHTNLRFGLYYSLFEWYNRLYVQDRDNKFETQHFVNMKSSPELRDLVSTENISVVAHILYASGGNNEHKSINVYLPFF